MGNVNSVLLILNITLIGRLLSQHEEWIIFVHGTLGLRQHLELKTFFTLFKENIANTDYQRTIQMLRDDPLFFSNQAMQECGLKEIPLTSETHHGPILFRNFFNEIYEPYKQHPVRYFTFGWSGLVNPLTRYQDALLFYQALQTALTEAQSAGKEVHIAIYAYSHGGNVALNLAAIRSNLYRCDTFTIEKLILIGTPVQRETDYLVTHPLFKKIYNIYSRADRIQRLDCFSFKRFFSRRRFKSCRRYQLKENIKQIEIQLKEHIEGHFYDRSPGHIELWFFGWPEHSGSLYRPHFPLHPLPLAVFLPAIIALVNTHTDAQQVIVELKPHIHKASIRARYSHQKTWVDFIPHSTLLKMREKARKSKPECCDKELFNGHAWSVIQLYNYHKKCTHHNRRRCSLCGS
jgi:hypothetical protein